MKVTIRAYHAVAAWKWDTSSEPHKLFRYGSTSGYGASNDTAYDMDDDDDDDEEDDVCGICRQAFEGCCPDCKVPGDDCPLSRLVNAICSDHCSMGRVYTCFPHALFAQMDRYRVFQTAMSSRSKTLG